ncbi:MoaD/ThiS family protein [Nocardioides sp. BYT-33-1]|uniref:MoaD/ThiS family protein n=1 Tax=Nocardioides sp. BYT-33-1 TaxID=3416952 RepID=UPI003F53A647
MKMLSQLSDAPDMESSALIERISDGNDCVVISYWAAAKSAAGVAGERVLADQPITLAALTSLLWRDRADLAQILPICSVIIDGLPVASSDPATVLVASGAHVEFLPPFAGG